MYKLVPIGRVRSPLTDLARAPKQGREGAPEAWLEFSADYRKGLEDVRVGDEMMVLTWLHHGNRTVQFVHPRDDESAALRGVFSTRSADRPNPIGLHRVRVLAIADGTRFRVDALEVVDGTPVIDIKPVIDPAER